jgi:hypothetical protein
VRVAQEHPQHAAALPDRRLGQAGPGTLGDKRAEQRRGQLTQPGDADSLQVGLEPVEMVPVTGDRRGPQATLGCEVLEEPRDRTAERDRVMRPAGGLEPGNDEFEQLLDRAADVLGQGLAHPAAGVAGLTGPLGHEGIDVARQVRQRPGALQAGELPEGDQQRHPPPHAPGAVAPIS